MQQSATQTILNHPKLSKIQLKTRNRKRMNTNMKNACRQKSNKECNFLNGSFLLHDFSSDCAPFSYFSSTDICQNFERFGLASLSPVISRSQRNINIQNFQRNPSKVLIKILKFHMCTCCVCLLFYSFYTVKEIIVLYIFHCWR